MMMMMIKKQTNLKFVFTFSLIVIFAIFLRCIFLAERPLHNDEGVNHFFVNKVLSLGYYPYSHKNYHGPSHFYILTFFRKILGDNTYSLRLASVFPGIAILFLFLQLRSIVNKRFIYIAAFLTSISTSMLYISRYSIHEMLFVFFTALFAFNLFLYFSQKKALYLYFIAIGAAGLITTKETFIITFFTVGLSFITILIIDYTQRCKLYYNFRISFTKQIKSHLYHILLAIFFALFLILATFSACFTWMGGIFELLDGVPQWISRNDSDKGHFKPYIYYISIFIGKWFAWLSDFLGFSENLYKNRWNHKMIEPSFFLIFLIPIIIYFEHLKKTLFNNKNYFFIFNLVWFSSTLFIYSWLNYKTPWLIINITFPGLLLIADILQRIQLTYKSFYLLLIFFVFIILHSGYYNFIDSYRNNPLAYVHTQDGMLDFISDIKNYSKNDKYQKVAIANKGYWPLPYYLKQINFSAGYFGNSNSNVNLIDKYNLITTKKNSELYKVLIKKVGWKGKEYVFNESNRVLLFRRLF